MHVKDVYGLPGLVSIETACKALGIATSTGYLWTSQGSFPVAITKTGNTLRSVASTCSTTWIRAATTTRARSSRPPSRRETLAH